MAFGAVDCAQRLEDSHSGRLLCPESLKTVAAASVWEDPWEMVVLKVSSMSGDHPEKEISRPPTPVVVFRITSKPEVDARTSAMLCRSWSSVRSHGSCGLLFRSPDAEFPAPNDKICRLVGVAVLEVGVLCDVEVRDVSGECQTLSTCAMWAHIDIHEGEVEVVHVHREVSPLGHELKPEA
eukprot:CAMPEP_0194756830 /NCGR_PEP_ID=MMETSP0323_2-20130528/10463_1 /TAXON_ID=2866 ORGANISM="Crypthecodinium cohnii, Strain Seligo" /NCGR_SAMPLE_ID=MMETSP0323_2 /ASSEMBLY_ACC=CAM_ASM_000346 /LENGTH=180 /DNA_ID=CAMNT_0039676525 /DNA_START=227 /DNA_END=764 /DNA_ORIENTATION=-